MLNCFRGYSLIKDFFLNGSTGGVISTLSFCILEMKLAEGIVCLNRSFYFPFWFIAHNKKDLLKAAGSTYEYTKFDFPFAPNLAQVGKPCDLKPRFFPKISLFCSHSYRRKKSPIPKEYARIPKSKFKTILENPVSCFLCSDRIGFISDISVGDSQTDPKLNVILIHSKTGKQLLDYAVNHKYLYVEKVTVESIKKNNPYLWRFRK